MQEFLKNNTVNCNLMSLTGYRTLVLLKALMESPKSIDELNECFLNNQYIKETFSSDTLRIYINSLRSVGCDITKANKATKNKYVLKSHPFFLSIPKSQLLALRKVYKAMRDRISLDDIITLESFLGKVCNLIGNVEDIEYIKNLSAIKNIDIIMLKELVFHVKKKNQINFLYNSPNSGEKQISIIADKLSFKSDKLYLWGYSSLYDEYSYFRIDRISKLLTINLRSESHEIQDYKVQFEITIKNEYVPLEDEKIISKRGNVYLIEKTSENKFSLMQKLLYRADDCKIISPENFKKKFVEKLKDMEEIYND